MHRLQQIASLLGNDEELHLAFGADLDDPPIVEAAVGTHPYAAKVPADPLDRPRQYLRGARARVGVALPQPLIEHVAGLRQRRVQYVVAPRPVMREVRPFLLLAVHLMIRGVPVQRHYLAPAPRQQGKGSLLDSLDHLPQLAHPWRLLALVFIPLVPEACQKVAHGGRMRDLLGAQHPQQRRIVCQPVDVVERITAGQQIVDQREDVIRLRIRLVALQHAQPGVDRLRDPESLDELPYDDDARAVQQRCAAMLLDGHARVGESALTRAIAMVSLFLHLIASSLVPAWRCLAVSHYGT